MAFQGVPDMDNSNSYKDACVKEYDQQNRTKECSKENTAVTDEAAKEGEKEELQNERVTEEKR